MATRVTDEFGSRANPPDASYPDGSLKNETTPGVSNDGSPLESRVGNDWEGFKQSVLTEAGITANGNPDSVTNPQILDSVKSVVASNAGDYTDIVYKASGGNSAVENMIAGVPISTGINKTCQCENGTIFKRVGNATGTIDDFIVIGSANPRDFGAVGDGVSDDSDPLIAALSTGSPVILPDGDFVATKDLILRDNQSIYSNNNGHLLLSATIGPGVKNSSDGYDAPSAPSAYYTDEPTINAGFTRKTLIATGNKDDTTLTITSGATFDVGDYISLGNGYCDMFRVLEQYTGEPYEVINKDVDLFRTQIFKIEAINGGVLTLDKKLGYDYFVTPRTYGFFPDENNLPQYAGYNAPKVEKMIGAVNASIRNIRITTTTTEPMVRAYLARNFQIDGVKFTQSSGRCVELHTCLGSRIQNSNIDAEGYAVSLRRGSHDCVIGPINTRHGGANDGSIVVWEQSYGNYIGGIAASTYGGTPTNASIAVYLNTCHSNNVDGVVATGFKVNTQIGFLGEGNCAGNLTSFGCDLSFKAFRARDFQADGGTVNGYLSPYSEFQDSVVSLIDCYDSQVSDFTQANEPDSTSLRGRIHAFKCINVKLANIIAPNCKMDFSTADDLSFRPDDDKSTISDSEFHSFNTVSTTFNVRSRVVKVSDTKIYYGVKAKYSRYLEFSGCKLFGDVSVELDGSPYCSFKDCEIIGDTKAFEFTTIADSFINLQNSIVDSPVKFSGYSNPTTLIDGGNAEQKARSGEEVTILDQYPLLKLYKNNGDFDDRGPWPIILQSPSYI